MPSCTTFNLDDTSFADFNAFAKRKLDAYPINLQKLFVDIKPLSAPYLLKNQILKLIRTYNFALFNSTLFGTSVISSLENSLDLHSIDLSVQNSSGISSIQPNAQPNTQQPNAQQPNAQQPNAQPDAFKLHNNKNLANKTYIPYTDRAINWHTDGYYNQKPVRSIILYCEEPSIQGGENKLLDHEIAYILLRQKNINFIKVLMQHDVMSIPANVNQHNDVLRQAISTPVFSIIQNTLHMRFTKRKLNIAWKHSSLLSDALHALDEILLSSPYVVSVTLKAGQGIVCNNILHKRSAFVNEPSSMRKFKRSRYLSYIY